ncbi:unnamed protein product [Fraxinus pennsylvanica]|uniref:Retrotransposon gag domain-containing protein n=1 Tax=Fraxinus pennsylvanica TaxID=56036 RepID=A0AAD1ZX42_9LAMI|nr:unnamed protein product [Fraxinus pennsylvanica]
MQRSLDGDLIPADPEIKRTFHHRQREARTGISDDAVRLQLFPNTLHGKVLEWLDSQPIVSINTWDDLAQKFCTKFFPLAKITKLKYDISIFRQGKSESFDEVWNRFKNMLRKCPHQGISKGLQVQYFDAGLLP